MTPLKVGAIALTLILTVPIILGYALSVDEHEDEREVTSRGGSLTENILNSTSPYFLTYTGEANNSMLERETIIGGASEVSAVTPSFVRETETYSTIPIYSTASGEMGLSEAQTATYTGGTGQVPWEGSEVTHTHYGYDVAVTTTYTIASSSSVASDTVYLQLTDLMELVPSGSYSVTVSTVGGSSQTVSTSGTLIVATNNSVSQSGLVRMTVMTSDYATYTGDIVTITHNGLGLDLYTSEYVSVGLTGTWIMNIPSHSNSLIRLDSSTNYLQSPETVGHQLIFDFPDGVYQTSTGSVIDGFYTSVQIASGRYHGITTESESAGFGVGNLDPGATQLPSFGYALLYTTGAIGTLVYDGGTYTITAGSANGIIALKDTVGYKLILGNSAVDTASFVIYMASGTLNMTYQQYTTLTNNHDVWLADLNSPVSARITYANGTSTTVAIPKCYGIQKTYDTVVFLAQGGNLTYSLVSSVGIATTVSESSVDYDYYDSITAYGQLAYGWRTPSTTGIVYYKWLNGYINSYVRLMVEIQPGEEVIIMDGDDRTSTWLSLNRNTSTGRITASSDSTSRTLGVYTYVMVEIDASANMITASGISAWGEYGIYPTVSNQVTFGRDLAPYTGFYLATANGSAEYRVDTASIQAGVYSTTLDYTLNVYDLYPDDAMQTVVIDSVGVYGDYLIIGDRRFDVTDNNITTDSGRTFSVRGLSIGFDEDGSSYDVTVGDMSFTTSSSTIYFGGEWSLTLHREKTELVSYTAREWVSGEFALDKEGFVLCMILVAGALFVVLGMTGARSGTKVGLLAVICGGACMVGLMII